MSLLLKIASDSGYEFDLQYTLKAIEDVKRLLNKAISSNDEKYIKFVKEIYPNNIDYIKEGLKYAGVLGSNAIRNGISEIERLYKKISK